MRIKHTKTSGYGSIAVAYPETFCESWHLSRRKGWTHKIDIDGHDYYVHLSPNAVREKMTGCAFPEKHKMIKDELISKVDEAIKANNQCQDLNWRKDICMCDLSVGEVCGYCVVHWTLVQTKEFLCENERVL